MKIWKTFFLLILILWTLSPPFQNAVNAENQVELYFFYDDACTHCVDENIYLDELETRYENIVIHRYEVMESQQNAILFQQVRDAFDKRTALTPFLVIGGVALIGFSEQTKTDIDNLIIRNSAEDHVDVVGKILGGQEVLPSDIEFLRFSTGDYVNIPLIGAVAIDSLSLFFAALVIGIVDGFNPCAMWILLFLVTMLLNMKNVARRWLLGLAFLMTSALVYFLIMVAWLNIGLTIAAIVWVRILIAVFAIVFGIFNLRSFVKSTKTKEIGCEVTDETSRTKIRDRIKKIINEKNLVFALLGIMVLAASVNLLELACSAGLPLLYTQILAYNQLPVAIYYLYIFVYIFFFLLDDIIVFSVAMITLQVTGISNKYAKISHLAGGIIMIAIGILLIFFPQIIMFS